MSRTDEMLQASFRDLDNCVAYLANNPASGPERIVARFVSHLDDEPLRSFLEATADRTDFDAWWQVSVRKCDGIGSGEIDWPHSRSQRVAVQVELLRRIAKGSIDYPDFTVEFTNPNCSTYIPEHTRHFIFIVLSPLVADIRRLSENRALPTGMNEAFARIPRSGDSRVDDLIAEAMNLFRDTAPLANRSGLEKLWDAWERLKSIDAADKKESIELRIRRVVGDGEFAELVSTEAKELTRIGNEFAIRHHEKRISEISSARQVDYLFYRMLSLLVLLISNPSS